MEHVLLLLPFTTVLYIIDEGARLHTTELLHLLPEPDEFGHRALEQSDWRLKRAERPRCYQVPS